MPFVIAGVAWLGRVIWLAVPWLVDFFARWITRRVAVAAAMIAAFMVLTSSFYAFMYAIISGVAVVAPPYFSQACGLLLPSNTYLCLSTIITVHLLRWVYYVQLRVLNYSAGGTS